MPALQITSEKEFDRLLTSLSTDVATASMHWKLFNDLHGAVNEFVRELNQTLAFWTLTFDAHRDVVLFRLGRLYDRKRGALALKSLIETVARNPQLFEEAAFRKRLADNPHILGLAAGVRAPDLAILDADLRSVSRESDPLVKKLYDVRNKILAHRDPTVVLGPMAHLNSVLSADDIGALLKRAEQIVGRYGTLFKANSYLTEMPGQGDFRRLLKHVRNDLAAIHARVEAEIAAAQNGS